MLIIIYNVDILRYAYGRGKEGIFRSLLCADIWD